MKNLTYQSTVKSYVLPAILIIAALTIVGNQKVTAADEVPAFFLKIAKNIPRIGRSEHYDDVFIKNSNMRADDSYTGPISEISKRKVGYSPESDTWAWQHFPLAIEGPPELWRTLAGYSHDPLYSVSDDFNNDLWSRDKRTNDPQK